MLKPRYYSKANNQGINPDDFSLPYEPYSVEDLEIMYDKYMRLRKQSYANFSQFGFGLKRL